MSVKDKVKRNTDVVVVPGGCTKYIQAPDVCWRVFLMESVSEGGEGREVARLER